MVSCLLVPDVAFLLAGSVSRLSQHAYLICVFSKHKGVIDRSLLSKASGIYFAHNMLKLYQNQHFQDFLWRINLLPEEAQLLQIQHRLEFMSRDKGALILGPDNFFGTLVEFKALGRFLGSGRVVLESLHIECVLISRVSALAMLEQFSLCGSSVGSGLRRLVLYNNGIGLEGSLGVLVRLLVLFGGLEQVSLLRNSLGDGDVQGIEVLLKGMKRLVRLSLSCNALGEGAQRALLACNTSATLDLSYNTSST